MKSSTLSACNRYTSMVDLKAAANVPNIITNMIPAVSMRTKSNKEG